MNERPTPRRARLQFRVEPVIALLLMVLSIVSLNGDAERGQRIEAPLAAVERLLFGLGQGAGALHESARHLRAGLSPSVDEVQGLPLVSRALVTWAQAVEREPRNRRPPEQT